MMPLSLGFGLGLTRGRGGAAFSPADLENLAGWWSMDGTGTLRADPSGDSETGNIQDAFAALVARQPTDTIHISQLDDLSGNGRHLANATAGDQPRIDQNTQNGLQVATFDGVDDDLRTSTFAAAVSQPDTIVLLADIDSNVGDVFYSGSDTNRQTLGNQNTTNEYTLFAGMVFTSTGGALDASAPRVMIAEFNGVSSRLLLENTEIMAGDAGANALGRLVLGSNREFERWTPMKVMEVLLIDRMMSTSERQNLVAYLQTTWAL